MGAERKGGGDKILVRKTFFNTTTGRPYTVWVNQPVRPTTPEIPTFDQLPPERPPWIKSGPVEQQQGDLPGVTRRQVDESAARRGDPRTASMPTADKD